jgi:hypothetical protein
MMAEIAAAIEMICSIGFSSSIGMIEIAAW